ncbi:SprT-like family-domain-containing protein [Aspergillus aurantiobrunneus]
MARLNTRSQTKQNDSRGSSKPQRLTDRYASPPPTLKERRREQRAMADAGETSSDRRSGPTEKSTLVRSKSTRTRAKTISEQHFDIFADSDGTTERDTPKAKKATTPLKLARTNSMILPLPQQPRTRTSRKSELYNYDKENDPLEEELDPEPTSLSRNPSDASSAGRSPVRNRNAQTQQFTTYRQQPQHESEDENDEDSFNSLDDFIVSDNDEPSYHETSDDDTEEEEHKVSPPPTTQRRRLLRGRRPNPTVDLENALRESSQRPDLRLEPSLPAAIAVPFPKSDRVSRRLFQKAADVSDKMDRLNLDDSDPSSQLQNDLSGATNELYSTIHPKSGDSPIRSLSEDSPFHTPPSSPSKGLLRSPTKGRVQIPPTPYRESADAFWSSEATNNWIDEHSPRKLNFLLQEFDESDCDPENNTIPPGAKKTAKPPSKTALKKAETEAKKAALARKRSFHNKKATLAEEFLKALDDGVSGGDVQRRSAETGGVRIVWSKTLQTTAGRASWRRDRCLVDNRPMAPTGSSPGSETPSVTTKHYATIELAERIIDDEDRLINTIAHEYCHLANYIVSNIRDQPHGASFQAWGRKCKEALRDHPIYGGRIEVTTKHSYKIDYKYVWTCVDCCLTYGRHSKSIDPGKHRCGKCKGLLQQIKPKPRSVSPKKRQPAVGMVNDMTKSLEVVELSP